MAAKATVWMMVTQDEYALPVVWAESAGELARILGIDRGSVLRSVYNYRHGRCKSLYPRYIKVEIEEGEDGQSLTCEEMAGEDSGDV